MGRAAVISGTFLRPSTSKNRRVYTPQNIKSAVESMQAQLAGDGLPLTMATGHNAARNDDALSTIGRITKVGMAPDGTATFEAEIADTTAGKDVAKLAKPGPDGKSFLRGVSIRGAWGSDPYTVVSPDDGQEAVTADSLNVSGIDFTWNPGVGGAVITNVESFVESGGDPHAIFESVEDAEIFVDEAAPGEPVAEADKAPYGAVVYADPGYQKDKQKRYPIDTPEHIRAAWSYINQGKNAGAYSANQLARIKTKIKRAAAKRGVDIVSESNMLIQEFTEVLEAYASTNLSNGDAQVSVSGYTDDAGKLAPMAARLAYAAIVAMNAVDPDADGDVDLVMPDGTKDSSSSGAESATGDDGVDGMQSGDASNQELVCGHCGNAVEDTAMYCPECGQPISQAEAAEAPEPIQETEESNVTTEATPAAPAAADPAAPVAPAAVAEAAPARALTEADTTALATATATAVAQALAPLLAATQAPAAPAPVAEAAPAPAPAPAPVAAPAPAPVVEAAPAAPAQTFTLEDVQRAAAEAARQATEAATTAAVEAFRAGPTRKGFVGTSTATGVVESGELDLVALAKMDTNTFMQAISPVLEAQPFWQKKGGIPAPAFQAA